jgi:ClpP class serine protease
MKLRIETSVERLQSIFNGEDFLVPGFIDKVMNLQDDIEKMKMGSKAAGARVRKIMMHINSLTKEARNETILNDEEKKNIERNNKLKELGI